MSQQLKPRNLYVTNLRFHTGTIFCHTLFLFPTTKYTDRYNTTSARNRNKVENIIKRKKYSHENNDLQHLHGYRYWLAEAAKKIQTLS